MKFGELSKISPMVMNESLPLDLYAATSDEGLKNRMNDIVSLFSDFNDIDTEFICFVEENAMRKFELFANEIYNKTHNEATGLLVGYYLTQENNQSKKFLIATDFLQASGNASSVTCEFSYEDSIQHSLYCEENHVLPIIWIHSHPGFGVFYSSTDSTTLASFFARDHQMGIVVDNLQNKYLGFKIINGQQRNQDIYSFNIKDSVSSGRLKYNRLNESLSFSHEKKNAVSFKTITTREEGKTTNTPVSFQLLQKISTQLDTISGSQIVSQTNRVITDLKALVNQLNLISQGKCHTQIGNFTIDDMRKELTTQISNLIEEVKGQFDKVAEELLALKDLEQEVKTISSRLQSITEKSMESDLPKGNGIPFAQSSNIKIWFRFLRFCESIKSAFNLRDLIYIIIVIVVIIIQFFKGCSIN